MKIQTRHLLIKTISGASNTISGLTVVQGGTGASTFTSGNFLQGDGTSAVTAAKVVPTGDVIGTTDSQTLTNKTFNDNLSMNSNKIVSLATPTAATDATTKAYVDSVAVGLNMKESVRAATITAGTLASSFANNSSIDGIVLVTGNRILIKDQGSAIENGIYTVNVSGAPTRASDLAAAASAEGAYIFVEEGTTNADSSWVCNTSSPGDIVGTNSIIFVQFSGAEQTVAGDGLDKTGITFSVDLKADGGLVIESGEVAVDLGASSITGTLTVVDGGTGATTFVSGNFLQGDGTSAVTASKVVPSGDVVGTTDSQTLTNKNFDSTYYINCQ